MSGFPCVLRLLRTVSRRGPHRVCAPHRAPGCCRLHLFFERSMCLALCVFAFARFAASRPAGGQRDNALLVVGAACARRSRRRRGRLLGCDSGLVGIVLALCMRLWRAALHLPRFSAACRASLNGMPARLSVYIVRAVVVGTFAWTVACSWPRRRWTALQTNRMCFAGLSNPSRRSASPTNKTNGFRWSVRPHVEDRQLYER